MIVRGTMIEEAIRKADVLIEAMDYIRQFRHRLVVIKLGGSVLEHTEALEALLQDVVFLETVGLRPVLVHGGGKAISQAMNQAGLEPTFIQGRRFTDDKALQIVGDVLTQTVNRPMVRRIDELGGWAMGLHYRSSNCLKAQKLLLPSDEGPIDLGAVGEVVGVQTARLHKLCQAGVIPVLPSLGLDDDGNLYNINADTAAAAVARFLQAEKLIFISDTPGILKTKDDDGSLIRSLTVRQCQQLIDDKIIDGGMIPKVEACCESLRAGVQKTHLIDGRRRHSLLLEIYTSEGVGTEIFNDPAG